MRLIEWQRDNGKEIWVLYQKLRGRWQQSDRYRISSQQGIYNFIGAQESSFDLAVMGLNVAYRNTFYALMPDIHIVIKPECLLAYVHHFYHLSPGYHEETAVSMDDCLKEQRQELSVFLKSFYTADNKRQADDLYNEWQLKRSIWNPAADKLQVVMEIFKEEIFNFFTYQRTLRAISAIAYGERPEDKC